MTDTIYRGLGAILLLAGLILAIELFHWWRARRTARRRIQTRVDAILADQEKQP